MVEGVLVAVVVVVDSALDAVVVDDKGAAVDVDDPELGVVDALGAEVTTKVGVVPAWVGEGEEIVGGAGARSRTSVVVVGSDDGATSMPARDRATGAVVLGWPRSVATSESRFSMN